MKKSIIFLSMIFSLINFVAGQTDTTEIIKAALDYADGFYSGDAVRMERAIHPDLNKAAPMTISQTGRIGMNYSTYSSLIELSRAKAGFLDENKRELKVTVLNINEEIANAKVTSAKFNDYLQLIKIDGQWKIINVLWTVPNRLKDFKVETEKENITKAVTTYFQGIMKGDGRRLEIAVDNDFNKVSFRKMPQTGKINIRRQRYQALLENTYAGTGKLDEFKQNYEIKILDIMDGLAVAELKGPSTYEYTQLYKADAIWKVFNILEKQNTTLSFNDRLPIMIEDAMPDFSLPIYQGGEFQLSKYAGKNVMLIFPRGWIGSIWCAVCHYQYLEMCDLEKISGIRKKYNAEIAFVLPYNKEKISDWFEKIPESVKSIERWKNIPEPRTKYQQGFFEFATKTYAKKFEPKKEDVYSIPVLIDGDRKLSKKLGLFTNFWDDITAEQNIPTILIIDKTGKVQFKYQSQVTFERPSSAYLIKQLEKLK